VSIGWTAERAELLAKQAAAAQERWNERQRRARWTVEGVLLCPDCTMFIDFKGTPEDLQKAIDEHEGLDH